MKLLANLGIIATACALSSAAPAPTKEPGKAEPLDEARRQVTERYFRAEGTVQVPQPPQGQARTDPKWVDSMQQLLKDLADDNAKLRQENERLRAEGEALKRQLEIHEDARRRREENQGTFVIPPDAVKNLRVPQGSGQVPENWRPFQFNGATYYVVPLKDAPQVRAGARDTGKGAIDLTPRGGNGTSRLTVEPAPAAVPK